MARRKSSVAPVEFSHGEPPSELLRFTASDPAEWTADEFAAFLRARVAWRDTHAALLPDLPARERSAMVRLTLPAALVQAENAAPKARPSWAERATARKTNYIDSKEQD